MGEMIYAPYDLTGVKFLWWTWHDTDAPVRERILGVPVGSTVWVITFTASFQVIFSNHHETQIEGSTYLQYMSPVVDIVSILHHASECSPGLREVALLLSVLVNTPWLV